MEPADKPDFNSYTSAGLAALCRDNPTLFDELAADAIKRACTGSTPEHTVKLRHMQWVIDAQLRKGKTPLARLHIMEDIFYGRVFGEDGHLAELKTGWNKVLGAMRVTGHACENKARMCLVKKRQQQ